MSRLKGFVWMSLEPVVLKRTERFKAKSFSTVILSKILSLILTLKLIEILDVLCVTSSGPSPTVQSNPTRACPKHSKDLNVWGFRYEIAKEGSKRPNDLNIWACLY